MTGGMKREPNAKKSARYHDTEFTDLTPFSSGMIFKSQKLDYETSFNIICQD